MYSSMIWTVFLLIGAVNGDSTGIVRISSATKLQPNSNGTVFDFGANMTMNAFANGTEMLIGANMTRNAMANDTVIVFDANRTKWTEHETKMLFVAPLMSNDSVLVQHANGTLFASLSNGTVSFVNGTLIVADLNGTQFTPNVNGTDIVYYANDSMLVQFANSSKFTEYANGTSMLIGGNMTRYANGTVIVYGANMSRFNNLSANEFVVVHGDEGDDIMSHFVLNSTWFLPYVLIGNVLLCSVAAAIIRNRTKSAYKSIEDESEKKVLLSYV